MKILLVDDHRIFLDGLKSLMHIRGIEVVGMACDGLEAVEKAHAMKPEVILMDIRMPNLDGLAATRIIKAEIPYIKIVMLSVSQRDEDLFEALKSGASGYLLKSDDTEKFFQLLSGVMHGEVPLSPGLARRVLAEFAREGVGNKFAGRSDEKGHFLTS